MSTTTVEEPQVAPSPVPTCAPSREEIIRKYDERTRRLLEVHELPGLSDEQRETLLDAANRAAWDDAIHVAAPWEPRSSLCGQWDRNLVTLDADLPDGMAGCWTCLMAAEWLDANLAPREEHRSGASNHAG